MTSRATGGCPTLPPHLSPIRRLRQSARGAKYPVFFPLQPLITWAFSTDVDPLGAADLLDRVLIQLRLTTLMRAGDLAKVPSALFHQGGAWRPGDPIYIHTTTKSGARRTYSTMGTTTEHLISYAYGNIEHPALCMFRNVRQPTHCLGAERIAKRCLDVMTRHGVDTSVFKSHSLRGAVATHLMDNGVPMHWVQARGGWASTATL